MSAMSEAFSEQVWRPSNRPSRDARRLRGTVYFAFKPAPDVTDHVVSVGNRLRAEHGLTGRVSPTVLHVTICPIGYLPELSDERIELAGKVASDLVARPFEIIFDRVRTYPNGQDKLPLVAFADNRVPKAGLFRYALIADLRRRGFVFRKKLPNLHMTLLYDQCVVAEEPIDPIRWTARDFVLVHSVYGEGRHVLLGQWPLRG